MKYQDIIPYVQKGLISEKVHPLNKDIRLFDYTEECQYLKEWDDVTTTCRGLIMNIETGEFLSNPFPKFFNYSEHISKGAVLPSEVPVVTEKMDGSLGVLYWLDGVPFIATRGSFESDQAKWATQLIRTKYAKEVANLEQDATYLFEIIYPANRIVLMYDFSDLVLLGVRALDGSWERGPAEEYGFKLPEFYNFTSPEELKKLELANKEGFVLHWPKLQFRLKIKFDEYVRLHKVVTGLSEIGIWEILRAKGIETSTSEIVQDVPDEFFNWLTSVVLSLRHKYYEIENSAKACIDKMADERYIGGAYEHRRDQAELIRVTKYPGVAFAMLDGKNYSDSIFKLIRPVGKSLFNF